MLPSASRKLVEYSPAAWISAARSAQPSRLHREPQSKGSPRACQARSTCSAAVPASSTRPDSMRGRLNWVHCHRARSAAALRNSRCLQ